MRYAYIDFLRGFAILLVVLGHTVQYVTHPNSFDQDVVFRMIYSFHIPLFFFISGLTTPMRSISSDEFKNKIFKRTKQLLIPFVIWKVLSCILVGFNEPFYNLFLYPDNGLWFLWVLFFDYLIFHIVLMISCMVYPKPFVCLIAAYLLLRVISIFVNICGFGMVSNFFLYFIIGSYIGQYKGKILHMPHKLSTIIVFFVCFMLFYSFWYRDINAIPSDLPYWVCQLNKILVYRIMTAFMGIGLFLFIMAGSASKLGGQNWIGSEQEHWVFTLFIRQYYGYMKRKFIA